MQAPTTMAPFKGVGKSGGAINHVCMQVVRGTLGLATVILLGFGYKEIRERRTIGEWGISLFFAREGGTDILQLIEPVDQTIIPMSNNHVALSFENAFYVADNLKRWVQACGFACTVEDLGDEKYWTEIPGVFTTPIELITE